MGESRSDSDVTGQLHHVELYTDAFDRSVAFWDWLLDELGYEPKNDWDAGRSWSNDPTYVVLVRVDDAERAFDRNAPGLNHLAFHAASRKQVDDLTAAVRNRDHSTVLYEDQHPFAGGYYALYCENPDGLKVEVVAPD
ncbi:VOC family protein [Salarchaeum sp. III]|uniref:VOC family protein n=1 Tax=Salarchaeum sp. III TaxID=3107927 RepID=UPI002ED8B3DD